MAIVLVIPIAMLFSAFFEKKVENTISIGICISIIIMFYAGFFATFTAGVFLIILLSIICLILSLYVLTKKKRWMQVLTPGMIFFVLFMAYSMISCVGREYANQDEYAAWAVGCKFMYLFDHYAVEGMPRYACFEHMPGTRLWDLLSTKIWFQYADGIMIFGQSMFAVSFLLPLLEYFSLKDMRKRCSAIAVMLFILFLPWLGRGGSFNYVNIMPDIVLAFESAYILMMFRRFLRTGNGFYTFAIFCGIFISALTKESGIVIAGLDILLMLWGILAKVEREEWHLDKNIVLFLFIQVMGIVIPAISWFLFLSIQDTSVRRTATFISALQKVPVIGWILFIVAAVFVVGYIFKKYQETREKKFVLGPVFILYAIGCIGIIVLGKQKSDIFCSQLNAFLYKMMSNNLLGHWLSMSLLAFMTFLIGVDTAVRYRRRWEIWVTHTLPMLLISYVVALIVREEFVLWRVGSVLIGGSVWLFYAVHLYECVGKENTNLSVKKNETETIVHALLVCGGMYLAFLFSSYSIGFSEYEASIAASADRYEQTYLLLMLAVFADIWVDCSDFKMKQKTIVISAVLLCIVMNTNVLSGIQQLRERPREEVFYGTEKSAFSFDDKICLVDVQTHYDDDIRYRFLYANYPVQVVCGPTITWYVDDKLYTDHISIGKIRDYLQAEECSYVYLQYVDDRFKTYYAPLFEDKNTIENNRLFRIIDRDGELSLEFIS